MTWPAGTRVARLYDTQLWLERTALRAAIEMAEIGEEDRLLDLGTGTGALLGQLAEQRPAPREAVGVDTSAAMLARAPALPVGWQLLRADAGQLPFPDRSFDVLTTAYLLHLLDEPTRRAVLAEARRVLRPQGRLVAVTVAMPRSRALARALSPIFHVAQRSSGVMAGLRPLDPRAELQSGGFSLQGVRRITRGYPSMITLAGVDRLGATDSAIESVKQVGESLTAPGRSKQR
jgi:ubiquinone/menaquinone biosynthesis C-methylase UbiE